MNKYEYAFYKWLEQSFQHNVSLSSVKVKLDANEVFLSARFVIYTKFDIQSRVMRNNIPQWAIQQEEYDNYNTVVYTPPANFLVGDTISEGAVLELPEPIFFQRYYDLGAPFELVLTEGSTNHLDYDFANRILRIANEWSLEHLNTHGYTTADGEIARIELPV